MRGTQDDRHSNEYISLREVDPLDPSPSFCRLSAGPISSALMERPEDWVARARVSVYAFPSLFWHQLVRAQRHVKEIRGKSIALFEFHGALREKVWITSRSGFFSGLLVTSCIHQRANAPNWLLYFGEGTQSVPDVNPHLFGNGKFEKGKNFLFN